jgi:signal transduction histidine kinase
LPPGSSEKGKIVISTRAVGPNVEVRVSDNGNGVPAAVRARVCEPFCTTGTIRFETEEGRRTTLVVTLALSPV